MHPRRNFELRGRAPWFSAFLVLVFTLEIGLARGQELPDGVDPYSFEFEKSPPDANVISRQWLEKQTREKQEQFAVRVAIPDAVKPIGGSTDQAVEEAAVPSGSPILTDRNRLRDLGFTALVLLALALLSRKIAPMLAAAFNARYNPWLPSPAMAGAAAANVLAEEQSFSDFVAAFRIGPARRPAAAAGVLNRPGSEVNALKRFLNQAPKQLAGLRAMLQQIKPGPDQATRKPQLETLRMEVRTLKGMAGLPELLPIWQMACAMEGLLGQLITKGQNVTLSTLRTIAQAVDLLDGLSVPGLRPDLATNPPIRLLAVDDDPISRHAVSFALKKALNAPELAPHGDAALPLCEKTTYDAIFLDVQMPGMDGFELCSKIHQTAANRATPVVFVTCQSDFEARAKSTLAGGNDLMGKPFLTFEITLKALTLVLRGRLVRKPEPVKSAEAGDTKAEVPVAANGAAQRAATETRKAVKAPKATDAKTTVAEPKPTEAEAKVAQTKSISKREASAEKPSRRKRRKQNRRATEQRPKDRRSRHGKNKLKAATTTTAPAGQNVALGKPTFEKQTWAPVAHTNGAPQTNVASKPASASPGTAAPPDLARDAISITGADQQSASVSDTVQHIQGQLNSLTTAPEGDRPEILADLCLGIHELTSEADRRDESPAFRLSWALQGMLRKLVEKPERASPSALRTAGLALNLLEELRRKKHKPNFTDAPARIMIVDDDPVARRAITGAIQVSFAKPDNLETGELAVAAASEKSYDVIFLDVRMPGMDGFTACKKIRETALNAKTPVVFITSHTDQEAQEPCSEAGGNGFIPKPASAVEVTLTALTHVLRNRITRGSA
jgi:CheY-like chemotaxis protein